MYQDGQGIREKWKCWTNEVVHKIVGLDCQGNVDGEIAVAMRLWARRCVGIANAIEVAVSLKQQDQGQDRWVQIAKSIQKVGLQK